jgi:thioredoxin reductase (NADPH)
MCPETVMSAQRIASLSDKVRVGVYDLQHFPEFRDKYRIMSVPCIVINDQSPQFGKKNITQFLELLK